MLKIYLFFIWIYPPVNSNSWCIVLFCIPKFIHEKLWIRIQFDNSTKYQKSSFLRVSCTDFLKMQKSFQAYLTLSFLSYESSWFKKMLVGCLLKNVGHRPETADPLYLSKRSVDSLPLWVFISSWDLLSKFVLDFGCCLKTGNWSSIESMLAQNWKLSSSLLFWYLAIRNRLIF